MDHFAYIIGYDDGTVRPLNGITRAEAVIIFFRLMIEEHRTANWSTTNSFSDVNAGNWFNNAVSTVQKAGALEHFAQDANFLPNQAITRAEVMTMVNRILGRVSDAEHMLPDMITWTDNQEGSWYYEAVQEATNEHAYDRDDMGVVETADHP